MRKVLHVLTARSVFDKDVQIPMYIDKPKYFGFPLHYFASAHGIPMEDVAKKITDLRSEGSKVKWEFKSQLWEKQQAVFDEFKREHAAGITGFLITAPPSSGKTVLLLKMLQYLQRTALVIVPKSDLVEQWVERICLHTSLRRKDIGIAVDAKVEDHSGKSIFLGLVHTLSLERFHTDSFLNNWGVLVSDEVDRSIPPKTFSPILSYFPTKLRIGASATLYRTDGLGTVFQYHFGECLLESEGENRMPPKIIIHRFTGDSGGVPAFLKRNSRRGVLISKLASNQVRNSLIAGYVNSIHKTGRRCIIISDRTLQLETLRLLLNCKYGIPVTDMGFYADKVQLLDGSSRKIPKDEMRRTGKLAAIVLATYGMMKMGTDIPDIEALVYGTPQADAGQSQGRVERYMEGKRDPIVVDFVDTAYEETVKWGNSRIRFYNRSGLTIKEYKT